MTKQLFIRNLSYLYLSEVKVFCYKKIFNLQSARFPAKLRLSIATKKRFISIHFTILSNKFFQLHKKPQLWGNYREQFNYYDKKS
jgi:hypothetical protein